MIEALVHDLGKATWGRFEDHAGASAELLLKAGFFDAAVLNLIERHHKSSSDDDSNLHLLQLADRLASTSRAEGGSSAPFAFISSLDYNYLRVTEAYLLHDLCKHFLQFGADYDAFKRFVQNCWWLELVRASTSDASNVSLREHLLLTDSIYQIYLKAADKFGFELDGRKAKDFVRYRISRLKILSIEGRPKDLALRIKILQQLDAGGLRSYEVWKGLMGRGINKKFEFVDKVLKELHEVGVLERDEERKYTLKRSLESKHSPKEALYKLPSDDKLRNAIVEMHSMGFSTDGIAYEVGLPELHVKDVLEGEIERM